MEQQNLSDRLIYKQQITPIRNLLTPANPIITKNIANYNQKINFKVDCIKQSIQFDQFKSKIHRTYNQSNIQPQIIVQKKQINISQTTDKITLAQQYSKDKQIFIKYNNQYNNKRGKKQYLASIFISIDIKRLIKLPQYKGMIKDDQLIFDSSFQSANLMSIYKSGQNQYNLILQNDINTSGFTQWYNFKITNKRNNFVAKFNIVNLYKSKSLYNIGMKPIVHSQKSDRNGKKTWRRKGFNIYYQKNDIIYQDNPRKCYKTLTFQYDFTTQNDTIQFAHAMPYDFADLQKLLTSIKGSQKAIIKQVGVTLMGKPINLVKISSLENSQNIEKKAIIVLSRQHPGETPGSFIVQQIIYQLLRHSIEVDFLTWRFDIYIFPMVNIDGVILGNYRGNFAGYDLNRCWLKADPNKQPQVFAIKNYIKKIAKKQPVQLILDLHGHSRKMGSFFYGNNFGKSPMLFPYIASRANTNIIFDDCKFSAEKAAKASTARVVLGNIIKQTGNVYTYEVSFFGNYKNNQINSFSFNEQHYKQLGKSLVLSMYRTYMQMYKQQKTLKQSIYLKNIKKQIQDYSFLYKKDDSQSGSDSQAQQLMNQQRQQLDQYFKTIDQKNNSVKQISKIIQQDNIVRLKNNQQYRLPVQKNNDQIKRKISQLLQKNINQENRSNIKQRLPSIYQKQDKNKLQNQIKIDKSIQLELQFRQKIKKSHGNRLKIYGQTFQLKSRFQIKNNSIIEQEHHQQELHKKNSKKINQKLKNQSNQYLKQRKQLLKSFNTIAFNQHKQQTPKQQLSDFKLNKKYKNRNNSLTLKQVTPIFNQQMVHQVVKVNKLDYHRVRDLQNQTKVLVQQMDKSFKLPLI